MHKKPSLAFSRKENHEKEFREGFNAFDWNHSGKISYGNLKVSVVIPPGDIRGLYSLLGGHEALWPQPD